MNEQEIQALVMLVRRAPLANMAEAEAVSQLLDKTIQALRQAAAFLTKAAAESVDSAD